MAKFPQPKRRLPANVKSIAKVVRQVDPAASGVSEYRIEGARGLVLHVLPSGTATWYCHYDLQTGQRRRRRKLRIGRYDDMPLALAIAQSEQIRVRVRAGEDPVAENAEQRAGLSFAELAEERFAKGSPLRSGTEADYRHVLGSDVLPEIGHLPAAAITRQHIIQVVDKIAARGATRRADTARSVISAIYNFGLDRGLVNDNPAAGMRNRHDNQPRETILTAQQLEAAVPWPGEWRRADLADACADRAARHCTRRARRNRVPAARPISTCRPPIRS